MLDILDSGRYDKVLLIIPSVAARYSKLGRKTAAADAKHCNGVGTLSYGTTLEFVSNDTNTDLLQFVFVRFIGLECYGNRKIFFKEWKLITGFGVIDLCANTSF